MFRTTPALFTLLSVLLFTSSLSISHAAAQQEARPSSAAPVNVAPATAAAPASPASPAEPSTPELGFAFRLVIGAQVGEFVGANGFHYAGRLGLGLGYDVYRDALIEVAVGYAGSLSINHLEAMHRHGAGVTLRVGQAVFVVSGGLTAAHAFPSSHDNNGSTLLGGHVMVMPGFQWGAFTFSVPFEADFFRGAYDTVGILSLGLAVGVATE